MVPVCHQGPGALKSSHLNTSSPTFPLLPLLRQVITSWTLFSLSVRYGCSNNYYITCSMSGIRDDQRGGRGTQEVFCHIIQRRKSFEKKMLISNRKGTSVTCFGEKLLSRCSRRSQNLVARGK